MSARASHPSSAELTATLAAFWPEEAPAFAAAADLGLVFAPIDFTAPSDPHDGYGVGCFHPTGGGAGGPIGNAARSRRWVDHVRAAGWCVWPPADRPIADYPTGAMPLVMVAGGLLVGPAWTSFWTYRSLLPAGGLASPRRLGPAGRRAVSASYAALGIEAARETWTTLDPSVLWVPSRLWTP